MKQGKNWEKWRAPSKAIQPLQAVGRTTKNISPVTGAGTWWEFLILEDNASGAMLKQRRRKAELGSNRQKVSKL